VGSGIRTTLLRFFWFEVAGRFIGILSVVESFWVSWGSEGIGA
jgi:hypothetical protein